MNNNKDKIENELIRPINKSIPIKYNSLNIYCGKQGSGKTYSCCRDIISICALSEDFHMLIYITKSGRVHDPTFETMKSLITVPIVYVSEDEAVDKVKTILYYKTLYHQIKNNNFENDIEDEQLEEIKQALQIKDMSRPSLNTMILMEDAANSPLLRNPSSFFSVID